VYARSPWHIDVLKYFSRAVRIVTRCFHVGDPTIAELGSMMEGTLQQLLELDFLAEEPKTINAKDAVAILNEKIEQVFPGDGLRAMISDGIVSDAAAGTDYVKLRADAFFNMRDLRVLEVHEIWVHLGTTLNGMAQLIVPFSEKVHLRRR